MSADSIAPTVLTLVDRVIAAAPEAPALLHGAGAMTYAELDDRARRLAGRLSEAGAQPGAVVAICLDRSPDLICGVLGILRAGAAYLPVDPSFPANRIAEMLADAAPTTVLTDRAHRERFTGAGRQVVVIEECDLATVSPVVGSTQASADDLCYVLFTSGSTGRPKGVAMHHAPLVNLIEWQCRTSVLGAGDRTLQFAPLGFDVSFQEIFTTLAQGGTLVLITDDDRLNSTRLLRTIMERGVTRVILPFVALQYLADAIERTGEVPTTLREVFTSGEQLKITPAIVAMFSQLAGCRFCNQYGPTEGHVVSELELRGDPASWPVLPGIGTAIDNVSLLVLDEHLQPVPAGEEGELYLGGACVARGYINRPELTAERFLQDPSQPHGRVYKTGDRASVQPDGSISFRGRLDGQVKVRGYRIELGDVEVALATHAKVTQAVVTVREDRVGQARLVAYYTSLEPLAHATLREHVAERLPDYMVPAAFVALDGFPMTPSGKIDRAALPAPSARRPELRTAYVAPVTASQRLIADSWADLLTVDRVGLDDNFFDLGGNSLLAMQSVARLEADGTLLPIVKLYQHPTVRACAAFVAGGDEAVSPTAMAIARRELSEGSVRADIAIIGMSGRFPGAGSVTELWKNLLDKRSGISHWRVDELDSSLPESVRSDPSYVTARGVVADADKFDAGFFGMNRRVAALTDPQQRVFLEAAWHALEDAAYVAADFPGLIGVYAGTGNNTYHTRNVLGHPDLIEQVGDFQVMTGNEKDYVATRVAFEFDLRGPAVSVHTACSTSLVAIVEAVHALRRGDCDLALAGGVSITVPQQSGALYNDGGMYSPDGETRSFDADGKGTTFSDGVAVVVLKRLDAAIRDRDHIYATIAGVALNNDGSDKASFTAPSVRGQAEVVAMAQVDAGVAPDQISYVEAHGTATPIGDPIEVAALTLAFGGERAGAPCALGSIKSNIGHLTAASGAAGVIKTALALRHDVLPASLGFSTPNPAIDFSASPFRVVRETTPWPRGEKQRWAGVSNFGVGGTNAHAILREPPLPEPGSDSRGQQLILLSAKTRASLDRMTDALGAWMQTRGDASLADAAYTLAIGRHDFRHRRVVVGASHAEVAAALTGTDMTRRPTRELLEAAPAVVFMFPGQGAQYVNMGRDLYASEPVFAEMFDRCCSLFDAALGVDLKSVIWASDADADAAATALSQTRHTQAALFTVQYSLATLWMHWGVVPDAMLGHSIGELTAACLAGVFSLEDAVTVIAARGSLMQALNGGSMLSVRAAADAIAPRLNTQCSIAAINGPRLCVVSGPVDAIAALALDLERDGVIAKPLVTSHAFHSPMMDSIVEPFRSVLTAVTLHAPRIPIVSTATARWLSDAEATSPEYWATHLRATVRFADAVKFAWSDGDRVMLEVGPRTTATTLARQQSANATTQIAVSSLGDHAGDDAELAALLKAVGSLWQAGIAVRWDRFYERERRSRISMPGYAFERARHWVDPVAMQSVGVTSAVVDAAPVEAAIESTLTPRDALIVDIKQLLMDSSGLELATVGPDETFIEMGLDSLFLTQIATSLSKRFGVKISLRQLNVDTPTLGSLADVLLPHVEAAGVTLVTTSPRGRTPKSVASVTSPAVLSPFDDAPDLKKAFGAQARIVRETVDDMTPAQREWFTAFTARYTARTAKSKAFTQANRQAMADPRVVTGFRPQTKELVYQVVVDRSSGCHLVDIDGNEYVDILSGFGSSMFGFMPEFIKSAVHEQLDTGAEIGPMHPLAAEVSQLLCELTGHDRAAVCNTGSEAVLGAMRMARTVSGRSLIIAFSGSYHGINDEVIIRGSKSRKSYPGAPGIMPESVANMLILDYGTPESLEIIRQRCHEAAAVLVEPVQSRRMEFRPVDFLREVRAITEQHGTALIFDEVITGFRMHPGGAQAVFGITADIGTYGKVIGGGMPIGAMIGKRVWMDALDGGDWRFGDDSVPEAGVTYFAGTFVRHPLVMAATRASLLEMKRNPGLYATLNARTDDMVTRVNALFDQYQLPYRWVTFGSAFKTKYDESVSYTELFFLLMRYHGVHVLDFPHFLTTAHTEADVDRIVAAVERTCAELRASGFIPERTYPIEVVNSVLPTPAFVPTVIKAEAPPVPGARLGRTPDGESAWYVPDAARPGKYVVYVPPARPIGDGCARWPGCCCVAGSRAQCAARDGSDRPGLLAGSVATPSVV